MYIKAGKKKVACALKELTGDFQHYCKNGKFNWSVVGIEEGGKLKMIVSKYVWNQNKMFGNVSLLI